MARANYATSLKHVLAEEGGKVQHPSDPGGRTNQGVTQRVYNAYRVGKGLKARDVYTMTAKERDEIYRKNYWDIVKGDELPEGIDHCVFDGAINSGSAQSVKWLQRALGVRVDGVVGEATLAAARMHPNPRAIINAMCDRRLNFMQALKTWDVFGKGWTRRVARVRGAALEMAAGVKIAEPTKMPSSPKANLEDAKPAPQTATADVAAGAGAPVGGVLAESIDKASGAIAPATGTSQTLDAIYTALVLAGVLITVGGIVYALYARRKRADIVDALDMRPATVVAS